MMNERKSAPSARFRLLSAAVVIIGLVGLGIGIASWWPRSSKKPQNEALENSRKLAENLTREKLKMQSEQQRGQRTLAQRVTDPVVGPIIDASLAKANAVRAAARAELQTNKPGNNVNPRQSSWRLEIAALRVVPETEDRMFHMEADITFSGSGGAPSGPVELLFHADTARAKKAMSHSAFNFRSESTVTVSSDPFQLDQGAANNLSVELQPYSTPHPGERTRASLQATLTNGNLTLTEPEYTRVAPRAGEIIVHIQGGRSADEDRLVIDDASVRSMPEMTTTVADWLQQNPGRPCLIRVDRAAHYETLAQVRQTFESAGIRAGLGLDQSLFFRIPLQELGIDLASAPHTTRWADLPDVFEEDPPGSRSYHTRKNVLGFSLGFDHWLFVPAKAIAYVQSDPLGSSTMTYYGPFPCDLKTLMERLRAWRPSRASPRPGSMKLGESSKA
jgi:hypothetical protein